ncbi:hypothetical protein ABW21_db0200069 [Orbilia brochopaga]|nr:hypothetical protein ABW21_db0200069 [Drechslerella brochopaga]
MDGCVIDRAAVSMQSQAVGNQLSENENESDKKARWLGWPRRKQAAFAQTSRTSTHDQDNWQDVGYAHRTGMISVSCIRLASSGISSALQIIFHSASLFDSDSLEQVLPARQATAQCVLSPLHPPSHAWLARGEEGCAVLTYLVVRTEQCKCNL